MYYSISVDGKKIHQVENKDPRDLKNVKVFAGDKFYIAADANYRNLIWESGVSGVVKRNTEIATIPSWGPQFRVSFDLKVNSPLPRNRREIWASVLSFKGNGAKNDFRTVGDRIPAIYYHKSGFLHFASGVNGNRNYVFNHSIKLKQWYSITIEQKLSNGKVI